MCCKKPLTPEEIDKRLEKFFTTHDFMTKGDFYSLTGMTRTTATRHIRRLCDEGKLENKRVAETTDLCAEKGVIGRLLAEYACLYGV